MVQRFKDLFKIIDGDRGKNYPQESDFHDIGHCLFLNAGNVTKNGWSFENVHFISKDKDEQLHNGKVSRGDLIITTRGTVGNVALYDETIDYNDIRINSGMLILRIKDDSILNKYAYYLLTSPYVKKMIMLFCSGSAQPQLPVKDFVKIKVPIPATSEQETVVRNLSTYDTLIEVNNKRIKLLEQMAEELYKEWFVRFRFPGYENAEFKDGLPKGWTLSTEYKPIIPKGWHYGEFGELGKFARGKNITSAEMIEGEIPVISAGLEPSGFHNEANVHGRSLTISASGANAGYMKYNLDDIWAADCSYYQDSEKLWFAYHSLRFLQPVISNLQCGAAQPHVHPKQINKLMVIIPPENIISKFCGFAEPIYAEIKQLRDTNNNLIKQRDLLLPRLMSGKLEV